MADIGTAPQRAAVSPAERGQAPRDGARRIRRRRRLPGGRAVLGGFLVAASAVGIFAAYSAATAGPQHSYAVAARDLEVGHRVEAGDLAAVAIDLPEAVRARALTDPGELIGAVVLARRGAGDLLHAGDLVLISGEPGTREMSFSVEAGRALGDRIRVGERVDVVATYGTGRDAYALVVVGGARVLRAQSAAGGLVADGRLQLTVELVDADDVLALAHAVDVGQVTVVRSTGADHEPTGDPYRPPGGAEATIGADDPETP